MVNYSAATLWNNVSTFLITLEKIALIIGGPTSPITSLALVLKRSRAARPWINEVFHLHFKRIKSSLRFKLLNDII